MDLAVAVIGHRERRLRPGFGLLGREATGFLGLGGLGVEYLQQSTPQGSECLGVVVGSLGEQERLGRRDHRSVARNVK